MLDSFCAATTPTTSEHVTTKSILPAPAISSVVKDSQSDATLSAVPSNSMPSSASPVKQPSSITPKDDNVMPSTESASPSHISDVNGFEPATHPPNTATLSVSKKVLTGRKRVIMEATAVDEASKPSKHRKMYV